MDLRHGLVALLMGALCVLSGCLYSELPGGEADLYVRAFAWQSDATSWTWEFRIPKPLYAHYRSQGQRPWCLNDSCDWFRYVTDPNDDAYIEALTSELVRAMESRYSGGQLYHNLLQFALDFVTAAIPYTKDSPEEWPKYPIETLVELTGDCEDTSILFASLVRPLDYGVHFLLLPGHAATAVEVHPSFIENAPYEVGYYTYAGKHYAFCETTGDPDKTGYIRVGQLPPESRDDFLEGNWFFYDVRVQAATRATGQLSSPVSQKRDSNWLQHVELP